jgi:hypothetical protein
MHLTKSKTNGQNDTNIIRLLEINKKYFHDFAQKERHFLFVALQILLQLVNSQLCSNIYNWLHLQFIFQPTSRMDCSMDSSQKFRLFD